MHPNYPLGLSLRRKIAGATLSLTLFALLLLIAPAAAQAQTATLFGALSNFDVLNDMQQEAHGFEIELDGVQSQDIVYTFPANRYGTPAIVPFGGGVYVRYMSAWDANAQQFVTATPVATNFTPTNGHQCVIGLPGYQTSGCEHFGVGTTINPTATIYHWLIADSQAPGVLTPFGAPVSIPAPTWTIVPPAQVGGAPVVVAEIQAPDPPVAAQQFGDAQWVKVYKTELNREVGLDELLTDNPVVPEDPALLETAWKLIQDNPNQKQKGRQANQGALGSNSHSVIRRYEFYKYTGVYDPITHEAVCGGDGTCNAPLDGELGDYIGAQMAAANVEVPTINVSKVGNGSVASADKLISCGSKCSSPVDAGTVVTLTASAASGSVFMGWGGDCNGTQLTCSVTVDRVASVSATFTPVFTLSIGRGGSGTVTGNPSGVLSTLIDCGKNCSAKFAQGTAVTLTATPAVGLHFVNWTGACTGASPNCTVAITRDTQVQANFAK